MSTARKVHHRSLDDDGDSVVAEVSEVVRDPDAWLDTPNIRFGGQAPRDLLETEEGREILVGLVQAIKHGMVT